MLKASFIVPCRNKEKHIAACARSVLAQTEPCTIFFSDQGSTDGTRSVLADLVAGYSGHHRVHLLDCPVVELKSMPGLNAHLNWLNAQIDGDCIIMCSADDLNHPDRVKYTLRAFEEHNPSYVNTGVQYVQPDGTQQGFTGFPNKATRWLGIEESIRHQIHSSGSSAWARDLYQKHGPLIGAEQQDMVLPCMALMERGIYFIDLPLHTYVHHADPNNTGFGGKIKAAADETERARLVELNNFLNVRNWTSILARWMAQPGWKERIQADLGIYDAVMEKIAGCAGAWAGVREALILNRVPPMVMDV